MFIFVHVGIYLVSLINYKFTSPCNTRSLIGHFIVSENIFDNVLYYTDIESVDNISDYLPIVLYLDCNVERATEIKVHFTKTHIV